MQYRCYHLYENITDGRGLAYRFVKSCGLIGALMFFISSKYEHGRRIECSTELATEVLIKKGVLKPTEI